MTFSDQPSRPRPVAPPRRRSPLGIAIIAIAAVIVAIVIAAQVWSTVAWYQHVGYVDVWYTQILARIVLFVGFGLIGAGAVWLTLWVSKRIRPAAMSTSETLRQFREQVRPIERAAMVALPIAVGFLAGAAMSAQWEQFLLFLNRQEFGETDPQFGLDVGFYVFTLPVLQSVASFAMTMTIVCFVLAAFVNLLYGGISGGGRAFVAARGARIQLAVIGVLGMLFYGVTLWLGRYALLNQSGDLFYGATYTDVNAVLPARVILVGVAIVVAALFLVIIWRPDWRIPLTGVGLMVLASIVLGGIYPAIVQRFQVEPNQQELESPFIQRNIDATTFAYGVDDVDVVQYDAATSVDADALREDAETTAQIRLLDPNVVSPAFQQLQQNRQYYNFPSVLNVDRYDLGNDELQDTVIALRELDLDGLSNENRGWVNDTTVYTHGFGVVAAYGNDTTIDGQPLFMEGGIPSSGVLGEYEPRVYFGQTVPDYSIVGAPAGTEPWELDYPDDDSPNGQVNTTYSGDGGPSVGSAWQRIAYAIAFGEEQILFSDRVTEESQILYHRDPLERVSMVAPYLELDSTTYPAVVDNRIVWVVDGYTTTTDYPYSTMLDVTGLFADASQSVTGTQLNYVRNSVKATVDAYDGTVTLYAWDDEDPILQAWSEIFPTALHPVEEISSELMSHLRYPADLFTIQRYQLATYHVTDAASFYSGQDFWSVPADPQDSTREQDSYYLTLQMPQQDEPTFSLTTNYIPGGNSDRNILTGYLAVNSETGSAEGEVDEDYGTLRLLELPRDSTIPGPGQVQNNFDSYSEAQETLNLLRAGSSEVISGNLLTLPVGGGLLYVQPVYVQSAEGTQVPRLRKVFVAFGEAVGFADTLGEALDQVFGEGAGDGLDGGTSVDPTPEPSPEPTTEPDPEPTTEPTAEPTEPPAGAEAQLADALDRANQALQDSADALAEGDWVAYGEAQDALAEALADATAAQDALG